jgi:hypothetical protein
MLHDFDEINAILSAMHDEGLVEPIDEPSCHPLEWAEVTGLIEEVMEEIYPEPMVDEHGILWYTY